jgi:protein-disulfide isomerase
MTTTDPSTPKQSRRGLFIAIAAVVVLMLGGGGYYGYQTYAASKPGDVNTPSPLGDIALGPADAKVTIIEYASMTCPHCATGKARYVFREFPLDQVALLGAVLARCIAKGDPPKFFNVIDVLFASQNDWVSNAPIEPLKRITKQFGLNEKEFEACASNEAIGKGIIATRDYAYDRLKVNATPTFFVNGKTLQGEASLEELAKISIRFWRRAPVRPRQSRRDQSSDFDAGARLTGGPAIATPVVSR